MGQRHVQLVELSLGIPGISRNSNYKEEIAINRFNRHNLSVPCLDYKGHKDAHTVVIEYASQVVCVCNYSS